MATIYHKEARDGIRARSWSSLLLIGRAVVHRSVTCRRWRARRRWRHRAGRPRRDGEQDSLQVHGASPEPRGHARHVPAARSCGQIIVIALSVAEWAVYPPFSPDGRSMPIARSMLRKRMRARMRHDRQRPRSPRLAAIARDEIMRARKSPAAAVAKAPASSARHARRYRGGARAADRRHRRDRLRLEPHAVGDSGLQGLARSSRTSSSPPRSRSAARSTGCRPCQPEEKKRGVIAMSAGNHAQGVAYHAHRLGIPATIVMPVNTPTVKVVNTRRHGAEVILTGETVEEAAAFAHAARARARAHLHPPLRRSAGDRRPGHHGAGDAGRGAGDRHASSCRSAAAG